MKKHILTAALILGGLTVFSQITVERSTFAAAGDWFLMATDTTIDVKTSDALKLGGANQNWNLTGWANRHSKDTTFYANGFTYPGAPAGCNLVSYEIDPLTSEEIPTYYNISNSALRVILDAGATSGSGGSFKLFQFPSTMGTKYQDSSVNFFTTLASDFGLEIPLIDSLRIVYVFKVDSEIDGYGKLKLDAGEFDVLRQLLKTNVKVNFQVRNIITGTYTALPGFGDFNENINAYTWLSANAGAPLLSAEADTLGNITSIDYLLASSKGLRSGLAKELNNTNARVYPNPAKDKLTIELQGQLNGDAQLSIYDILGNEVIVVSKVSIQKGLNQIPVDLNDLKPGVYFFNLVQGEMKSSQRFIVE